MFGRNKSVGTFVIIVDIGSGSVGVSIADLNPTLARPSMIFTHREIISVPKSNTTELRLRSMREALLRASLELGNKGVRTLQQQKPGATISTIHIVAGAPWARTAIRYTHFEDTKPFSATANYVDHVLKEAEKQAERGTKEEKVFEEFGLQVVSDTIVGKRLNGYTVHSFTGQKATELQVSHLVEMIPKVVLEAVREAEKRFTGGATIVGHSFSYILHSSVRALYPHTHNFLAFDITGEGTECTITQNCTPIDSVVIEYGIYNLLRDLSKHLKTIPEEAGGHLKDFIAGKAHPEAHEAITAAGAAFTQEIKGMLQELREKYVLPQHIFLTTDSTLEPYLATLIERAYAPDPSKSKLYTIALDEKKALEAVTWCAGCPQDLYTALEAAAFHRQEKASGDAEG